MIGTMIDEAPTAGTPSFPPPPPPKKRTMPILAIVLVAAGTMVAMTILLTGREHKPTPPQVTVSTAVPGNYGKALADHAWQTITPADRDNICNLWPDGGPGLIAQLTKGLDLDETTKADVVGEIVVILNRECP